MSQPATGRSKGALVLAGRPEARRRDCELKRARSQLQVRPLEERRVRDRLEPHRRREGASGDQTRRADGTGAFAGRPGDETKQGCP